MSMRMDQESPLYYFNRYGIIFYRDSQKILSSEELSTLNDKVYGFSSEGFYQLEKIFITKDIREVEWNGLGRYNFKRFEVDSENKVFQEINGILYSKKGYDRHGNTHRKKMIELVACPTNVINHNVHPETIRIANCAFKGTKITNLSLPNTLEEIGTNAFYFADELKYVEIPINISRIESQLTRKQLLIGFDNHQFESWDKLFDYMIENGYEKKDNKIIKKKR